MSKEVEGRLLICYWSNTLQKILILVTWASCSKFDSRGHIRAGCRSIIIQNNTWLYRLSLQSEYCELTLNFTKTGTGFQYNYINWNWYKVQQVVSVINNSANKLKKKKKVLELKYNTLSVNQSTPFFFIIHKKLNTKIKLHYRLGGGLKKRGIISQKVQPKELKEISNKIGVFHCNWKLWVLDFGGT